ncbi:hypothetical protein KAR91_32500 [Candidatus Pacearchaeota archaeon]|nr:hypothetical protein [Candidatus Pacearchaeota archaeon]
MKKKKSEYPLLCDMPDCSKTIVCGIDSVVRNVAKPKEGPYNLSIRLCESHYYRHHNKRDRFDVYRALKLTEMVVGVHVDRFGHLLPHDHKEFKERARVSCEVEKEDKREKSLNRLKKWKSKGLISTKPKPRPEYKVKKRKVQTVEIDDIVSSMMN